MAGSALVFGASGVLGTAIAQQLDTQCSEVFRASRSARDGVSWISTNDSNWVRSISQRPIERVVWAQGANASGGITHTSPENLSELFEANVSFIVRTLSNLLEGNALAPAARLCVVSSVWQLVARDSKLAYMTTKAAVGGLVRSLAVDLGPRGIAVNAVLPGVIDSPMSEQFLGLEAMQRIADESPMGRLATPAEVASVVGWLTGPQSSGITGQSIVVDQGWSQTRHV